MRKAGAIATMHCLLHWQHLDVETDEEAVKTVVYGPLTSGQGSFVKHSWYVWRWVKKSVFVSIGMAIRITILSISKPPLNSAAVINYLHFVLVVKDLNSIK